VIQRDLFGEPGLEPKQQVIAREKVTQEKQIRRVAGRIRVAIEGFVHRRANSPEPTFTMVELHEHVAGEVTWGVAPGSTDRILRLLRRDGHLNYRVLDRQASLYEALPVPG
jgi:hypothetical protein